ncbi:MAG: CIA30 family protein [Pseudomonadota bacterium]
MANFNLMFTLCTQKLKLAALVIIGMMSSTPSINAGGSMLIDDFSATPEKRWSYVADTVMGGVSTGSISFEDEAGTYFVRLTGDVSTENNGGFIQVRKRLPEAFPAKSVGLRLVVRGNGESYFVFLRSRLATRPWHSYRAKFATSGEWAATDLPLDEFTRSHSALPEDILPGDVTGIGIVAYGADYEADISVAEISLY